MKPLVVWVWLLVSSVYLYGVDATLKIEKDVEARTKIALIDASTVQDDTFFQTLQSDLKISGHFLPHKSYRSGSLESDYLPPSYKSFEYVLKYRLEQTGTELTLSARLLESATAKEKFAKTYTINQKAKKPFLAHRLISDINDALGYPSIEWINRYVIASRYTQPGKSEIFLADYTFGYQKSLIRGGLNLFPIWADADQRSIYYSAFGKLKPTLYRLDIYTGEKTLIAQSEGMIVCSDVDTQKGRMLLTMAPKGQPDIFLVDVDGRVLKQLTRFSGIDVGGKFVSSQKIAFVSNRLGKPNVFLKSIDSSAVAPAVFHGKNNNGVDAHEGRIVYSSRESDRTFGANRFNIYLSNLQNGETYPITTTGTNQFPRFSNDGSVVLFIKRTASGTSVGYSNLSTRQSVRFPLKGIKIQSINW